MKKFFCEFLEHLWCFLDAFWRFLVGPSKLLLVFDGIAGGETEPGNLNGSCVRDPVAGALEFD